MIKNEYTWDKENKELIEITKGDSLTHGGQPVEGRFEKKFIYPHNTAIDIIKELERQIADNRVQLEAEKEKLSKVEVITRRVDKAFYEKYEACQSMNTKKSHEANIGIIEEQYKAIESQLTDIKKEMGRE